MLIDNIESYTRILAGLQSKDPEVKDYANCCLSYLVCFLRLRMIVLPPHVVAMLNYLPEV